MTATLPHQRRRSHPSHLAAPTLEAQLADALATATRTGEPGRLLPLMDARPVDRRDAFAALAAILRLGMAPLDELDGAERWQHHPAVAALRWQLERDLVEHLDRLAARLLPPSAPDDATPDDTAAAAMRRLARRDAVPEVYRWLAAEATLEELVAFLSLEGGPDGGFDDLVALCQVGLHGAPKLELARNYWDEMGRGRGDEVHTVLHQRLQAALGLGAPMVTPPESAVLRGVLGSFLALSHEHQPEAVGAFGLIELQAGPRCRKVLEGLRRVGAPAEAVPFYAEHAEADPRHGRDWLDHAVAELGRSPRWADGIVRGARWRAAVDRCFLADAYAAVLDRPGAAVAAVAEGAVP